MSLLLIISFILRRAKARRKGFSYKRGSQAANTINLFPNVTVTLAADQLAYLTDKGATTFMAKKCLDHFEEHTFWKRGYISEAIDDILMGYRVSTKGLKNFGWLSNLYSVAIGKNESAAVGKTTGTFSMLPFNSLISRIFIQLFL